MQYKQYDLIQDAKYAMNYLMRMVDEKQDYLPYWLVVPHSSPAYAKHCRVDDAELVASWYEAIDALGNILGTTEGEHIKEGFYRHLMKSWGEHGLRYHEKYPWTHTMHSSFHEMGYVLNAMNRVVRNNPEDKEAEERTANLIKGMRELVIVREKRTFWSGDFEEKEPIYKFPNDVYLQEGGFDQTRHTGRGEESIRNGIVLYPLVVRYAETGDEVALDLAKGIANYLLGASRYFNYKMEFFGHVHSAVWVAGGLVKLGHILGEERYLLKGKAIYDYVLSLSSSFGWVPEYAQWHDPNKEHCETCCIKDMIECGMELIEAGYDEYYDVLNRFTRNQLNENQVTDGSFVPVDNSQVDTEECTYQDIDKRIVGGYTGGSEPNCISLKRFRSIAGCCVGTGPQALEYVWNMATTYDEKRITVNFPMDKSIKDVVDVTMEYPNNGSVKVITHVAGDVAIRTYDFMNEGLKLFVNGKEVEYTRQGQLILLEDVAAETTIELTHPMETRVEKEVVRGVEYTVYWRGCDVVDMTPRAEHIRLYQRDLTQPKYYPTPDEIKQEQAGVVAKPTN